MNSTDIAEADYDQLRRFERDGIEVVWLCGPSIWSPLKETREVGASAA